MMVQLKGGFAKEIHRRENEVVRQSGGGSCLRVNQVMVSYNRSLIQSFWGASEVFLSEECVWLFGELY